MIRQEYLTERKVKYSYGEYNKVKGDRQRVRITEGCPHNCPYCYEPTDYKVFDIPPIERNIVEIMDMNLLAKPESLDIIKFLGLQRVNGKVVHYELICGADYRFLTQDIANALKESRFHKLRIAWDGNFREQLKIKDAINRLIKAGYRSNDIMVYMICNWAIPYNENLRKLDLLKVWRVKACDCYYDNQVSPNIEPIYWRESEIKDFRRKVRKHNQLVNFLIDPEEKLEVSGEEDE